MTIFFYCLVLTAFAEFTGRTEIRNDLQSLKVALLELDYTDQDDYIVWINQMMINTELSVISDDIDEMFTDLEVNFGQSLREVSSRIFNALYDLYEDELIYYSLEYIESWGYEFVERADLDEGRISFTLREGDREFTLITQGRSTREGEIIMTELLFGKVLAYLDILPWNTRFSTCGGKYMLMASELGLEDRQFYTLSQLHIYEFEFSFQQTHSIINLAFSYFRIMGIAEFDLKKFIFMTGAFRRGVFRFFGQPRFISVPKLEVNGQQLTNPIVNPDCAIVVERDESGVSVHQPIACRVNEVPVEVNMVDFRQYLVVSRNDLQLRIHEFGDINFDVLNEIDRVWEMNQVSSTSVDDDEITHVLTDNPESTETSPVDDSETTHETTVLPTTDP